MKNYLESGKKMLVAIPLYGKMAFRSFHTLNFITRLMNRGLKPVYYIDGKYLTQELSKDQYSELFYKNYKKLYDSKPILKFLSELRRFIVHTETTQLRFRDSLWDKFIFSDKPILFSVSYIVAIEILRRIRLFASLFVKIENSLAKTSYHIQDLKKREINCVLTPGVGSYGFLYEGLFALEAQRAGIRVVSSISNYDNIINRGYRNFMPTCLAVWSKQMAEEAIRLIDIPAKKIEITGPVQFDRYFSEPPVSREEFLRSRNLDPKKKTIFFAGGTPVTQYYDFFKFAKKYFMANGKMKDFNLVIRPVPHNKVLSWYGMDVLIELLSKTPGIYVSDPRRFSPDSFMPIAGISSDIELDELHCLFKYSDILINIYSTVSLEAAINDLPTIHIGYETFSYGLRYPSYVGFHQRMTHNRRKLRLAAARIARSDEELIKYVEMYIKDRSIDKAERYEYALSECGYLDGRATERLATILNKFTK